MNQIRREMSSLTNDFSIDWSHKLGEGAFSNVFAGKIVSSKQDIAVKIVDRNKLTKDEETTLRREIDILDTLSHRNILGLVDVKCSSDEYRIVTELMQGGDLLDYVTAKTDLNVVRSREICHSLVDAVDYLHSKHIVHRDIKLENILLSSNNEKAVIKLADFGFAKIQSSSNELCVTMCGTPSYVAPEVVSGKPYNGMSADMWSIGVVSFILLSGIDPFQGEEYDNFGKKILEGSFTYDTEDWSHVSIEAVDFVSQILVHSPEQRLSSNAANYHKWFKYNNSYISLTDEPNECIETEDNVIESSNARNISQSTTTSAKTPVYFMIGSQRSGSNWLRTMLVQREDLFGPHPPHIMRDFMPILQKFGDISQPENFRILVDHVCTFVERNQVPWTDKHSQKMKFVRKSIYDTARSSCECIRSNKNKIHGDILEDELYLLSIFDAVMDYGTKVNGKHMWICKSMGMSKYHKHLLDFYGEERLRYIYLVRDPRDVAMSFMKTPVGDCHWYTIANKWVDLQKHALHILVNDEKLTCKIHYEDILKNKEKEVKKLYDFIGKRRFAMIKRQASVMFLKSSSDLIGNAKHGHEASKACTLSYQFKNLVRGNSFIAEQIQKWRHPTTGLKEDELQIIETVAGEMMGKLGYELHQVGKTTTPSVYSEQDMLKFSRLNKKGIEEMNRTLQEENPDDLLRRLHQAEILSFKPELISANEENESIASVQLGRLQLGSTFDKDKCIKEGPYESHLQGFGKFICGGVSVAGYYPGDQNKQNEDAFSIQLGCDANQKHWLSVYDGHGPDGQKCSDFVRNNLPEYFFKNISDGMDTHEAMVQAYENANKRLVCDSNIDTTLSGTTAVTVVIENGYIKIYNVGDSPCIIGSSSTNDSQNIEASVLTEIFDLSNEAEKARIETAGGLVMTAEEYDGLESHSSESQTATRRMWLKDGSKQPGCAFTRSIGDSVAQSIGVIAEPGYIEHRLSLGRDKVLILASDGVTDFLSPKECIDIAWKHRNNSLKAASALVEAAEKEWAKLDDYVDDITAVVVFF